MINRSFASTEHLQLRLASAGSSLSLKFRKNKNIYLKIKHILGTIGAISILILHCRNILSLHKPPNVLQKQEIQNQGRFNRNARTFADLPTKVPGSLT